MPSLRKDAAAERWGEPALRNLERWLTKSGTPEANAVNAVAGVWVFYSYYMLPELRRRTLVGITGQCNEIPEIHLYPIVQDVNRPGVIKATEGFEEYLQKHRIKAPKISLQVVTGNNRSAAGIIKDLAKTKGDEYIGVYRDDLGLQLAATHSWDRMALKTWLETPNMPLGERKPSELLDGTGRNDRALRDTILGAITGQGDN